MLSRLRSHVRHNVVGYLALFFALTGVAYAAGPLKAGDPAGGDLTGTYPNPNIASGVVKPGNLSSAIPAARVFATSNLNLASGDEIQFPLDAEAYDTAGLHSTTDDTSRLTAPVAGIYRVSAHLGWVENPDSFRLASFYVNGSNIVHNDLEPAVRTQDLSTEVRLAAGDYVEVFARQDSGSTLGVRAQAVTMSWVAPG
jgi:hypothetical protein